jgi:small subunit ribosomal protein S17
MKQMIGTVVALSTPQTAKVSVTRQWSHPLYKKSVKRSKNYACHVDGLKLVVGDQVVIAECKPVSKTKHFTVVRTVSKTEEVA